METIGSVEKKHQKSEIPSFKSGDTVKLSVKVKEGDKERIQVFQGVVTGIRGGGTSCMFTVRKISGGVGVERVFPLHSPIIGKVEVVRRGRTRRAKLNYLRERMGKAARIKAVRNKGTETEEN